MGILYTVGIGVILSALCRLLTLGILNICITLVILRISDVLSILRLLSIDFPTIQTNTAAQIDCINEPKKKNFL